jgi:phospholipase/carboxylesterase
MDPNKTALHQGQPVLAAGVPLEQAKAALLMVHGRGASAQDILSLSVEVDQPGFAYLAPQAAGGTWYPYSFLEPLNRNEPWLSSALLQLDHLVQHIKEAGLPHERMILVGFSQGACLALEYAARNTRLYGGIAGLSGGLIGSHIDTSRYQGSLQSTPVFLGCSDVDPHIPQVRVEESAQVLKSLGGEVTSRIYPGMGHTVNQDELDFLQEMMKVVSSQAGKE